MIFALRDKQDIFQCVENLSGFENDAVAVVTELVIAVRVEISLLVNELKIFDARGVASDAFCLGVADK